MPLTLSCDSSASHKKALRRFVCSDLTATATAVIGTGFQIADERRVNVNGSTCAGGPVSSGNVVKGAELADDETGVCEPV